jgi:Mn2+/Fe2+ NRAMP family transporter
VLIANFGVTIIEFVGIGAAFELFGISRYLTVPLAAVLMWHLVLGGSYKSVERLFLGMTFVFFAYPVAAIFAQPNWGDVLHGTLVPTLHRDPDFITLLVGLIGTSITPYMQLFQQSAIVEKGVARDDYGPERTDIYVGAVFTNLIAAFIVIATAATLHATGQTDIRTASDAAQALAPAAGQFAEALFAVGLLGAALLAAGVLPLATAYSISEAFGFRKGVNLDFRRARTFMGLFTALVALGAAAALIPNLPVIQLLVWIQVLNGVLLPVVLVFILLLINNTRVAGQLRNGPVLNVLGWATVALVVTADVFLLGQQALGLLGMGPLGGG